jgi:hypothetical protein
VHERLPREEWTALIPNAHAGYITWEDLKRISGGYARTRRRTGANDAGVRHARGRRSCKASRCAAAAGIG